MNIVLGLWLDSGAYPDALEEKEASSGTVVTGFHGLIGILETQLGLTSPKVSENLRIAEWQELLRKLDDGSRPYSKSFATDSWNSAKELLRRRDELVMAGWDPSVHPNGSKWLTTLAELEQANSYKTRGFPDRVRVIQEKLQESTHIHIDSITIVDEDVSLWDPWARNLLNELSTLHVKIEQKAPILEKEPTSDSDLSRLQKGMAGTCSNGEASGDGSLLLVRSQQEWDAADFLASWLQENGSESTVLIKGEGSLFLDELFQRRGVPAAGADASSKWRAILQVLPLTIDTYWQPLRVERMMELLTIPASPVPGRIRSKLARVLASAPGVGGPEWLNAMEEGIQESEEAWREKGLNESEIKKRRNSLEEKLNLWVRHDFYHPRYGIPYENFVEICQKMGQWAATNLQLTGDSTYSHALKHSQEVVEGVKSLGVNMVTRLQVARILDSVLGEGTTLSNYKQQASSWKVVHHPGQIWDRAETIIWWGFHKNMSSPSVRTWTAQERKWLSDQGVVLMDEDVSRRREALSWQRAARLAGKKLILIAPRKVKGQEIPIHPLWDEIRYSVASEDHLEKRITMDAAMLRKQPQPFPYLERVALSPRRLPDPIRKWRVPQHALKPQEVESATSFERLVGCPLKWTFQYAANIRPGSTLSLPNESLMLGNLGHAVLERLINEKTEWNEEEVRTHAGEIFDELVPRLAAPLLEPQHEILRIETRFHLITSLQKFFQVLNRAGIRIHHTELEKQKTWSDGVEFKGRMDLVGDTSAGNPLFLDAKWSKNPKNYRERLEKLSVQLTLYHWLLADHEDEELPVAYFMLRSGDFFALPHDDFPSDYHVQGPSILEAHKVLREAIENVWSQLLEGSVIAPGIPVDGENDEDQFQPMIDPPCQYCEYQNLCGFRRVRK